MSTKARFSERLAGALVALALWSALAPPIEAQPVARVVAVSGTFSVSGRATNPAHLYAGDALRVDSGSVIVVRYDPGRGTPAPVSRDAATRIYFVHSWSERAGDLHIPSATPQSGDSPGAPSRVSRASEWRTLVQLVQDGSEYSGVAATSLGELDLLQDLRVLGFQVMPEYPDRKYLAFGISPGVADLDERRRPVELADSPSVTLDDTVAIVLMDPADTVAPRLPSLAGDWAVMAVGVAAQMHLELEGERLSGSVWTQGDTLEVANVELIPPLVTLWLAYPEGEEEREGLRMVGLLEGNGVRRIRGIFEDEGRLFTWIAERRYEP